MAARGCRATCLHPWVWGTHSAPELRTLGQFSVTLLPVAPEQRAVGSPEGWVGCPGLSSPSPGLPQPSLPSCLATA